MQKPHVYIVTSLFPYGKMSETFLAAELALESSKYDICVIPMQAASERRTCPPDVTVDTALCRRGFFKKMCFLLASICSFSFWKMLFKERKEIKSGSEFKTAVSYFYGAKLVKHYFRKKRKEIPQGSVLYSYWFSEGALGLAMARHSFPELASCRFVARAHGHDVYMKSRGIHIPCREFILEHFDIYTVSQTQAEYLKSRYPKYRDKVHHAYLGIAPLEETALSSKRTKADISFVSCSSAVAEKRLGLIFTTLCTFAQKHPHQQVCWTHIGTGIDFDLIGRPANLNIDLKGYQTIDKIYDIYRHEQLDIFLNLSCSEGLPVSLMEAINASIPIIATDAGGTREIACADTGQLLPIHFTYEDFEQAVEIVIRNHAHLQISCREYFLRNFVAKDNFDHFYDEILFPNHPTQR